jgi:hypothetical protein
MGRRPGRRRPWRSAWPRSWATFFDTGSCTAP